MKGLLILVVGPSGVGKDTILRRARQALREDDRFWFPRRVVTRQADDSEDHETATPEAFAAAEARGAYALTWRAHGLSYGAPAEIAREITAGRVVVLNGSREIVGEARRRFSGAKAALITARPETLAARLAARGRDADTDQRLSRETLSVETLRPDLIISNDGSPEESAARLIDFLLALAEADAHPAPLPRGHSPSSQSAVEAAPTEPDGPGRHR
jgi:ribose 1,5-bisphosphokinase